MTNSFHLSASFHIVPKENACISSAAENALPHFLITLASHADWALRQNKKRIFVPSTLGCLPLLGLAGLSNACALWGRSPNNALLMHRECLGVRLQAMWPSEMAHTWDSSAWICPYTLNWTLLLNRGCNCPSFCSFVSWMQWACHWCSCELI